MKSVAEKQASRTKLPSLKAVNEPSDQSAAEREQRAAGRPSTKPKGSCSRPSLSQEELDFDPTSHTLGATYTREVAPFHGKEDFLRKNAKTLLNKKHRNEYYAYITGPCLCNACTCGSCRCVHVRERERAVGKSEVPTYKTDYVAHHIAPAEPFRPPSVARPTLPFNGKSTYGGDFLATRPSAAPPRRSLSLAQKAPSAPFSAATRYQVDFRDWGASRTQRIAPPPPSTGPTGLPFLGQPASRDYGQFARNGEAPSGPSRARPGSASINLFNSSVPQDFLTTNRRDFNGASGGAARFSVARAAPAGIFPTNCTTDNWKSATAADFAAPRRPTECRVSAEAARLRQSLFQYVKDHNIEI